ncbi:myelin-associated glycoprotein-like [Anoplopoma fimbria]|uniref:myelin-associated glycoprotein-like n=1 Tax=Anoplopoma fimbria TaxID=229290 RepID=UPI0023EAE28D|nr:myelin-associated glycoprotein-like [Anoplopoma fimbria]XP_054477851.1 myelin-associated glycoprotein-like [Anoplopoma fimbria]
MGTAHLLPLLSLLTGMSMLQQVRSWSITVPTTVSAVEGSCVVVPCQTQSHSRVTWYQYHNIHYPVVYDGLNPTKVADQFRGRTSVPGKAAEGNCTLVIHNVKIADNHLNVYVWINPDAKQTQKFHHQTVTILVERKAPTISIQKKNVDGEIFQANCSIKHSCPLSPPSLHWTTSSFLKNSNTMAFSENVQGQWSYTKTLHGLATYEMHNTKMWCSAKFMTFSTESQKITLNILYKPVTVTLILEKKPIVEGGSVTMECSADCNPQSHKYIWLKRQMGQNNEITSTKRKRPFSNITRKSSFSCIAYNDIGEGKSNWVDLDVQHAPVILPESSCHLTRKALKCVCQAEASPNASIYWIIDGNHTLPSSFSILSAKSNNVVSGEISGPAQTQSNISCTATNSLGSDTKQLSIVFSNTSSLYMWLLASMLLGIGLLSGCAMFIIRKQSRNRPQSPSDNVPQDSPYTSLQRSQDEDAQSRPCSRESNPEEDRLSCVYDNEFVEEMSISMRAEQDQRYAAPPQRESKSVDCNEGVYRNC